MADLEAPHLRVVLNRAGVEVGLPQLGPMGTEHLHGGNNNNRPELQPGKQTVHPLQELLAGLKREVEEPLLGVKIPVAELHTVRSGVYVSSWSKYFVLSLISYCRELLLGTRVTGLPTAVRQRPGAILLGVQRRQLTTTRLAHRPILVPMVLTLTPGLVRKMHRLLLPPLRQLRLIRTLLQLLQFLPQLRNTLTTPWMLRPQRAPQLHSVAIPRLLAGEGMMMGHATMSRLVLEVIYSKWKQVIAGKPGKRPGCITCILAKRLWK